MWNLSEAQAEALLRLGLDQDHFERFLAGEEVTFSFPTQSEPGIGLLQQVGGDMMDDFSPYEELHTAGAAPRDVYQRAKADGLDEIGAIRMLRTVFGMSLGEAKRAIGAAEALDQPQPVALGGTVYWEGSDTIDGAWVAQAQVKEIRDGHVFVTNHRKFLIESDRLVEVAADGLADKIRLSYFEKSLSARLQQSHAFWQELAALGHVAS